MNQSFLTKIFLFLNLLFFTFRIVFRLLVDVNGHVAFALDNNRGRDGEAWQAEHFVVLHDEGEG
jgi:hypothetical protein